jgi:hypothetical protein
MQSFKLLTLTASLFLLLLATDASEGQDRKRRNKNDKPTPQKKGSDTRKPITTVQSPAELAERIDEHLNAKLTAEKVPASPRCDDAEFLRRVSIDILGVIPPPEKVLAFLANTDPNKRTKLIDELLASPRYGDHQADVWTRLIIPKDSNNRFLKPAQLRDWLAKSFNENKPWNQLVTDLLTASGSTEENGAAVFYMANNSVDKMTDLTSRLFMGVQLQCAQCHNHMFVPEWKQDDYWGMSAFFLKVRTSNPKAAKGGGEVSVDETPVMRPNRRNLPEAAKILPPKFFLGDKPNVADREPLRPVLAKWLTAAANPYFAPAMVNRTWAHFFGRGIVNPIDDFQEKNKPSHPELLQDLSQQFIGSGYNLKQLIKAICLSDAYQRTSRPVDGNKDDVTLFSHMSIKNLTPSQLYDCLEQVLGSDDTNEVRRGRKQQQAQRGGPRNPREAFIAFFQTDDGTDPLEYQAGIPQALRLMNSQARNSAAVVNRIAKPGDKAEVVIERLYLMTLSRKPTPEETSKLLAIANKNKSEIKKVYEDILWALLNSSEFAMNH